MKAECSIDSYPDSDWPFTFYFNGEALPKWSACWPGGLLNKHLRVNGWNDDVSDRDVWLIQTKIDHVGKVESAPPAIFLFGLQRVILLLLEHPDAAKEMFRSFQGSPDGDEVMNGLLEGSLRMRELALRDRLSLWTSGYEADRINLNELVNRFRSISIPLCLPPHQERVSFMTTGLIKEQLRALHRFSQDSRLNKDLRARLREMQMPEEGFLRLVV